MTLGSILQVIARTVTIAAVATTCLQAQKSKPRDPILIAPGARRNVDEESRLQASPDSSTHWLRVYDVEASTELTTAYYRQELAAKRGWPPDSSTLDPGQTSPTTYDVTYHTFDDQCMDPPAAPGAATDSATGTTCRKWRRGKDKKNALGGMRIGAEPNVWIERAVFTWYHRDVNGELTRLRVELRDTGLTENWKHYEPQTEIIASTTTVALPAK